MMTTEFEKKGKFGEPVPVGGSVGQPEKPKVTETDSLTGGKFTEPGKEGRPSNVGDGSDKSSL